MMTRHRERTVYLVAWLIALGGTLRYLGYILNHPSRWAIFGLLAVFYVLLTLAPWLSSRSPRFMRFCLAVQTCILVALTMVMFYVGMRFLDYSNRWLQYGRGASFPFFFLHQPVIIVIAFYVVQWDTGILPKLLVVVMGSFLMALVLVELLIWPFKPVRRLFGLKAIGRATERA